MKITKLREFSGDIRDVAFLDEGTLVCTKPSGDIWRVPCASGAEELMFSGREILYRVAERIIVASGGPARKIPRLAATINPASGGYPRLAVSDRSEWIVVNTHDLVLVACRGASSGGTAPEMRLLTSIWGHHYIALPFSADGSSLAVGHLLGRSLIFDMHNLTYREVEIGAPFAWYPDRSSLLGFNRDGWLISLDVTQPNLSPEVLYNLEYDSVTESIAGVWVHPSGESCVTIFRDCRWSWWQLKPFQLLSQGHIGDGDCWKIHSRPGILRMAVTIEQSLWIGDLDNQQTWNWMQLASEAEARFSPSGRYMVTLSRIPTGNPYPKDPIPFTRTATLWELDREAVVGV
jgi:hypothetical protein